MAVSLFFYHFLSDWFDNGLDPLYLFALCLSQYLFELFTFYRNVGIAVFHVNTTYLVSLQTTNLTKESNDVALGNLVLLAFANVKCGILGRGWDVDR